jgi:hypothetical protein
MPVHDWTRVDDGTFHAFHTVWISELMKSLNGGILPSGYYAMAEQVAERMQTDVLTLHAPVPATPSGAVAGNGGVAVAEAPPHVRFCFRPDPKHKPRRTTRRPRHVAVRHITGHRVIALLEIASPANKDRRDNVRDFAGKIIRSLESGVHVLMLDLFPPGKHDPHGLHGAVWSHFDTTAYDPPDDLPLTLASYAWDGTEPTAFLEPVAVGQVLLDMPLFLTAERYVNVPLEATYRSAYDGMPEIWRNILEQLPPETTAS